ncbi:MAG: hypothetical protein KDA84_13805, partial [Planctomycetaceae bacterium]|nr:hypothetical protein [Planctomycetaceae bacterium]
MKALLTLGGAFNPVHTQHVAIMKLIREIVESTTEFQIVAGYLAPATDGYVKTKLKHLAMKG